MIPLMSQITKVNTCTGFILPKSIKREKSRGQIDKMGKAVAQEIRQSIEDNFEIDEIVRISFVCHSLGGLIAREAMSHLLDFSDKFYAYISLASPHLGILNSKVHIQFGLWVSEIFKTYE